MSNKNKKGFKMSNTNPLNKTTNPLADAGKVTGQADAGKVTDHRKGAPLGTPNEVFLEILPDERISRHKALKLIRELGLSCSQARMAEIIELKYGPELETERKTKSSNSVSKLEREKRRKEAEEKALALVRAKREAAKKGEPVDGYKAEVYVAVKDPSVVKAEDTKDTKAEDTKDTKAEDTKDTSK
jgi:hypothetical protein